MSTDPIAETLAALWSPLLAITTHHHGRSNGMVAGTGVFASVVPEAPGMRLLDCGCGPGSITVDLAHAVAPGEAIGIDLREDALAQAARSPWSEGSPMSRSRRRASINCPTLTARSTPRSRAQSSNIWPRRSRRSRRCGGCLVTEAGPAAGSLEETRRVAQAHLIRLRGVLGELAMAQGWTTKQELEQIADAVIAWGEEADAFYARPAFMAIGWV